MEKFTAKNARDLVKLIENNEYNNILEEIKKEARNGYSFLNIYNYLSIKTKDLLEENGFEVVKSDHISLQEDDVHYSIEW